VNVRAALAVAPRIAALLRVVPAADVASTIASATMTLLCPARKGTQSRAIAAGARAPSRKPAARVLSAGGGAPIRPLCEDDVGATCFERTPTSIRTDARGPLSWVAAGCRLRAPPELRPTLTPVRGRIGSLEIVPARDRPDLLAEPVRAALGGSDAFVGAGVVEIDPSVSDTAAFCDRYGVRLDESANCVVVAARREGTTRLAGCVVLATTRVDVNGVVRRLLDARKASFAPQEAAAEETRMELGGITPVGMPADWTVLVDAAVAAHPRVVVGSGRRLSKLVLGGAALLAHPGARVVDALGR
jgi:prolyl-tRNA editing enzyme YbaK/EbsC (Cys-tRNA(Pro) deacylase)